MDKSVLVEEIEGLSDGGSVLDAVFRRETPGLVHPASHGLRTIGLRIDVPALLHIIGQLHDVVVEALLIAAPHLQNGNQARVTARDGLVFLDGLELALEGLRIVVVLATDHLDRTHGSGHASCQPDLAIGSPADHAQRLVIPDVRDLADVRWKVHGRRSGIERLKITLVADR